MLAIARLTLLILLLTAFLPNPFFQNCTSHGCVKGRGWPFPYHYQQFCRMSDVDCYKNYIPPLNLAGDILIIGGIVMFLATRSLKLRHK